MENIRGLGDGVLKAYLAATVKNKCLNYLKRRESELLVHEKSKGGPPTPQTSASSRMTEWISGCSATK